MEKKQEDEEEYEKKPRRAKGFLSDRMGASVFMFVEVGLLFLAGFFGYHLHGWIHGRHEKEITPTYLGEKLSVASDLTSAELSYSGLVTISDGDILFINKAGFTMRYTAQIRAGINVKDIGIEVKEKEVIVTLPAAQIQSVNVDSDSVSFYDVQYAIFNWDMTEDVADAVIAAEQDAREHANMEGLKAEAEQQTEEIVRGLLEDLIGERKLTIKHTLDENPPN